MFYTWRLAAIGILTAWLSPSAASAETTLAWKLQPGDELMLHTEQSTTTSATVVSKTVKTSIAMQLDSRWRVEGVEDGVFKIRQTITRAQATMQAADSPAITYDTAAAGQPPSAARDLTAALAPLVDPEASILLSMNERGEILSAELSPKLKELTVVGKDGPTASLDTLLKQPLVTLPDKPIDEGSTWKVDRDISTPAGKYSQATTYTYEGEKEWQGKTAAAIAVESTLTPIQAGKAKLKEQSQTGTIHFDAAAGRMLSSEQKQRIVTETPYRDTTITVEVVSEVTRRLVGK